MSRHAGMLSTITPPSHPPTAWATATTYAGRTIRQFVRTPQLLVVNAVTSIMFLLIFRFVFGGAIQTGSVKYVDFLIPALASVSGLFSSGAVGVAEDADTGMFDRMRSLPVPRGAVLLGRAMADTALITWGTVVTLVLPHQERDVSTMATKAGITPARARVRAGDAGLRAITGARTPSGTPLEERPAREERRPAPARPNRGRHGTGGPGAHRTRRAATRAR